MTDSLWKLLNLLVLTLLLIQMGMDYFGKKIQQPLDKEPITVKMEGSWEQFGKLTFNDSVLTKDD